LEQYSVKIYHSASLETAQAILLDGFENHQHFLDELLGVWVTDLPHYPGSAALVCPNFPDEIFLEFEHPWAHAWRKAFVPAAVLNQFWWQLHDEGDHHYFHSLSSINYS
jgi:hypothetical protein